jgi:hypothetical protein
MVASYIVFLPGPGSNLGRYLLLEADSVGIDTVRLKFAAGTSTGVQLCSGAWINPHSPVAARGDT